MKLLVIGCGSIGSRHARNASSLVEVAVVDQNEALAHALSRNLGVQAFTDVDEALTWQPDGVIIATPHATHVKLAHQALQAGSHLLIEKPISDSLERVDTLLKSAGAMGKHVCVVCNMRFHRGPATLMAALPRVGTPLFARAHYGNYLPNMRPTSDYRKLYCAQAAEGGGVILDAIHEIDYLMWLFGPVSAVSCEAGKLSDLEIDVEDYAAIAMRHKTGLRSEIHLDYVQQVKQRGCEIVGTNGTLVWHSNGKTPERITVEFRSPDKNEVLFSSEALDADEAYVNLVEAFLSLISGNEQADLLDGHMAAQELRVALGAKQASELGQRVTL